MQPQKRTIKSITLTSRYHWSFIGGWLAFTIGLTILLEFFVLRMLGVAGTFNSSIPTDHYALVSLLIAVLIVVGLTALAVVWAHRIAGTHLRTERVFREVADGARSVSLRFRESDQLEDLEDAFDSMLKSYQSDAPPPQPGEAEADAGTESSNRRDWRNMQLTSKYHFSYMAIWVLLSIGLLAMVYAAGLLYLYLSLGSGQFQAASIVASLLALLGGGAILFRGVQTAHRIAGVHIRLIRTFQKVAQGERDITLRFRSSDKMQPLEDAFQLMMASLNGSEDTES